MSFDLNEPSSAIMYVNLQKTASKTDRPEYHEMNQAFGSNPLLQKSKNWVVGISRFRAQTSSIPFVPPIPSLNTDGTVNYDGLDGKTIENGVEVNCDYAFCIRQKSNKAIVDYATNKPAKQTLPACFSVEEFFSKLNYDPVPNNSLYKVNFFLSATGQARIAFDFGGVGSGHPWFLDFSPRLASILGIPQTNEFDGYPYALTFVDPNTADNEAQIICPSSCIGRIDQLTSLRLISKSGLPVASEIYNVAMYPVLTDFLVDFVGDFSFTHSNINAPLNIETNGVVGANPQKAMTSTASASFMCRQPVVYTANGADVRWLNLMGDSPVRRIEVEMIAILRNQGTGQYIEQRMVLERGEEFSVKIVFARKK